MSERWRAPQAAFEPWMAEIMEVAVVAGAQALQQLRVVEVEDRATYIAKCFIVIHESVTSGKVPMAWALAAVRNRREGALCWGGVGEEHAPMQQVEAGSSARGP